MSGETVWATEPGLYLCTGEIRSSEATFLFARIDAGYLLAGGSYDALFDSWTRPGREENQGESYWWRVDWSFHVYLAGSPMGYGEPNTWASGVQVTPITDGSSYVARLTLDWRAPAVVTPPPQPT